MKYEYKLFLFKLRLKKIFFLIIHPKLLRFYIKGIVPSIEHLNILKRVLKDSKIDTFFDVGSNKGQFTLLLKILNVTQNIYSFDPLTSSKVSFSYIYRYFKNIKFYSFAISNKCTFQKLFIPKDDDSSSLLRISSYQNEFFSTGNIVNDQDVKVITLKHWFDSNKIKTFNNGFLKIDVQGSEINVLKGAENFLEKFKYIYIELSFKKFYDSQILGWDIIRFLSYKNFKFIRIENCIYDDLILIQADFLFVRN